MVIECEGKKVEWWRVHEEGLPNWSSCCPLLWPGFTSLVLDFLSLGHGEIKKFEEITVSRELRNICGALLNVKGRIFWAKILGL